MSYPPRTLMSALVLALGCLALTASAQDQLTPQKKFDLGVMRYSEGLDFYDGFLWHTAIDTLHQLDPAAATDTDGDGDYDLRPVRSWALDHVRQAESSVWFEGELFNFAYRDTYGNLCDSFYRLNLNDNETYWWEHIAEGQGTTNFGTCRDRSNPGQTIIYTGHYDNLLLWLEPATGLTTRSVTVPLLDWIEDLGMDRYHTVWASSFDHYAYPGLYRIDPGTGELIAQYAGPDELPIIDGIAIDSLPDHDRMYVTGKDSRYIWQYVVPALETGVDDGPPAPVLELHANYPNPFNPRTTITYRLARDLPVQLAVYDLNGRRVRTLVNETREAGLHSVDWNGADDCGRAVATGTYLYRLTTGQEVRSRRMVLVR